MSKTPEQMADYYELPKPNSGPFFAYASAVGDCAVLEVGMKGSYKMAVEVGRLRAKRMQSKEGINWTNGHYMTLKKQMKEKILKDLDALFGDLEGKDMFGEDGVQWK